MHNIETAFISCSITFALLPALASEPGEVLYNGIVLPSEWPPGHVQMQDFNDQKVLPEPPYLKSPPEIIPIDVGRQMFVDDFLIEKTTLKRCFHRPEYHEANPVFSRMAYSGGAWYDPQDGLFKLWYNTGGVGLTTSEDGIHWTSPTIVTSQNVHSTIVWLDHDSEYPGKRFKLIYSRIQSGECNYWISYSPDGVQWSDPRDTQALCGDRSSAFYNPFRKVWVFSLRHGWGVPRARRYWEMRDLEEGPYWGKDRDPHYAYFWVGADKLDPMWDEIRIAPQLYNLDAAPYESLMLGLFTIWRGDTRSKIMENPPTAKAREWQEQERPKINEICLGYSRDGWHWSRPDRQAFLSVSADTEAWNFGNVQSVGGCCLVVKDQLYFYVSGRHPEGNTTGLAILRRDGFASMDADDKGGTLTTRLVKFQGRYLFVNVDNTEGDLRVEVLDEEGEVIEPFSKSNCVPVSADKTLAPVRWKGAADLSGVSGKPVRFRFHLTNGKLYAFWVSPDTSGASYGYVAAGGPGFSSNRDTVGRPDTVGKSKFTFPPSKTDKYNRRRKT